MLFPIMNYIYNKISDKVDAWDFCDALKEIQPYREAGHYTIPTVEIDGNLYYDPKSSEIKLYHHIEEAIMLLQKTKEEVGW